jgi:ABC-2 type transport system permease protein
MLSLSNIRLIAKREYLERVRTKAFLLTTVLIPVLMGGGGGLAVFLANRTHSSAHIAILIAQSEAAKTFGIDLQHELESGEDSQMKIDLDDNTSEVRARLDRELKGGAAHLSGYLQVLPSATPKQRPRFVYKSRNADITTEQILRGAIKTVIIREHLTGTGMGAADIDALTAPVDLVTSGGNTLLAFGAAYGLFLLMYMVIMLYAMNTARSIIEEKTSRVFEVLLSTIRPDEMLAGKILGVGSVGLTQVGIWMLAAGILGTIFAPGIPGLAAGQSIFTFSQLFFFVAYFVYGFMLYSSIAAALGAMTNSEQELQQLNMFLVMPLAFCMLCLISFIKNPDSALSRIVALIPFCSPLLMNFRVSIGNPQPWELILSFVLMTLTILGILWFSSRIYRVGILMYGKKPNLPEILRWLKYS